MKEISNSALALMVVMAIVISAFGTFLGLSKLNQLGTGITGFATTASGTANLTVPASADISLIDNLNALGTLRINETNTSDIVDDYITVRNDGSVNVTIQVYAATQGSSSQYPNYQGWGPFASVSTDYSGCQESTPPESCFFIKCNSSQSGTQTNTTQCNNTYYALYNASGQADLLARLNFVDTVDEAVFGVNVTVPLGEPSGNKQQTLTFSASQST